MAGQNGGSGTRTARRKRRVTPKRQRRYTDAERFAAITLARQSNVNAASKQLGIPEPTIRAWVAGLRCEATLRSYEASAGKLADAFHKAVWDLLAAVAGKIEDAPLNHLMAAAKIATEMEQLLRGKPTAFSTQERLPPSIDLSRLNPAQLAAFRELLAAARTPGPATGPDHGRGETDPTESDHTDRDE